MNKFDKNFDNYTSSLIHSKGKTIETIKAYFSRHKFNRIADVGCGAGHLGNALIEITDNLVYVDPSPNMLKQSKLLTTDKFNKSITFLKLEAETLDRNEHGTFDLILTRMALHHFQNASQAILKMCHCLNNNGYLVISDLYASSNKSIYDINQKIELLHDNTHVRNYTNEEVIEMVKKTNLNFNIINKQKDDGISIDYWCSLTNSNKEEFYEINKILSSLSIEDLKVLGYFVDMKNEIKNCIKTSLLIFKLQN